MACGHRMNQRNIVHDENFRRYTGFCVPIVIRSSITLSNGILIIQPSVPLCQRHNEDWFTKDCSWHIFDVHSKFDTVTGWRSLNNKADYFVSKIIDYNDWGLASCLFSVVSEKWGPFTVDWFASEHNAKNQNILHKIMVWIYIRCWRFHGTKRWM